MAGFDYARTLEEIRIPTTYELGVFMAVGYPGNPETLPDKLKMREMQPRERFLQQEFVMNRIFD